MIQIRPAEKADAPGVARVHVQSWQETYKGIIPDHYLAGLSVAKRTIFWRDLIAEAKQHALFVALDEDVVGFVNGGPSRSPDLPFDAELYAIYLLRSHQGMGVGERLFDAVTAWIKHSGFESMMLWVLRDNPTLGFYQHLGGHIVSSKHIEIGGVQLEEVAVGWPRL